MKQLINRLMYWLDYNYGYFLADDVRFEKWVKYMENKYPNIKNKKNARESKA